MWCVYIGWATLVVACTHRPEEEDNNHRLHASLVTSAYNENDVCECQATSAKACMRQTWYSTSLMAGVHQPTLEDIDHGLHTLGVTCAYLETNTCHIPRNKCIKRGLCTSARRHRSLPASMKCSMRASVQRCLPIA